MGNVDIPQWLKGLPLAPEFRPTDTEFADPIAYISKIEKEASAFGICKVIPPLPKPSKKYVFSNLNKSLLKTRELGIDGNLTEVGDSSKKFSEDKRNEGESRAVFTTRQQELGQDAKRSRVSVEAPNPGAQKQVWQSGEFYTLEQFESKSKVFSRSVLSSVKEVTPLVIEALFWKAAKEKPIYVEYANDVPGSGFQEPEGLLRYSCVRKRRRGFCAQGHGGNSYIYQGREGGHDATNLGNEVEVAACASSAGPFVESGKGFMDPQTVSTDELLQSNRQRGVCMNTELEGTAGWKLSNCPWNLQVIARSAGSLTRYMLDDIPGVTSPMIYIGMLFSWFAWHVEDHELHSLNFLHTGSPKTWYAVPGNYAFAFEDVVRKQAYGGDVEHFAALKILGEKTTLLSPEIVVASDIPCCRLVQNPGEFVVTFPRAYHIGFSHGFNCGEAANFGTPQWLSIAKEAAVRRAVMDHLPMLSHQQLLYLLTMSFISRIPRSLLPGVRSSRLKNRMKEERELLVKKAFIKDMLKENNLLHTLLGKDSAFRAVLWHPDSLPSFDRDSTSPAGPVMAAELSILSNEGLNQERQVSCEKPLNDLYLESSDLLCDFQVDSGTLVCVACGILGYPIMSVVQPSKKASIVNFPAENTSVTGAVNLSQQLDLETNNDWKWDTSVFLRPRIFCLEHALHVEELLRSKGGAKMLVICHSDYQKIKANATAIAEELRSSFNYKEVQLDSASLEELKLIDLAIDSEQLTDFQEDWTAKLGMNLRFSVKTRKAHLPKKIEHELNVDHLLSIMAPVSRISRIKWCSRKSRTKREPNHRTIGKSFSGNTYKKDELSHFSNSMEVKPKTLLQYCRRKLRAKSGNSAPEQIASEMVLTTEILTSTSCDFNLLRTPLIAGESNKANECIDAEKCFSKENKASDTRGENELAVDLINDEMGGADVRVRHEVCAFPSSKVPEILVESETFKPDSFSTCTEVTMTMEVDDMHVFSTDELHDSLQGGVRAPSMTSMQKERGKKLGTAKGSRGGGDKGKRKFEQQCEAPNDFVRSPCEGLRPRKNKEGSVYSLESELPEEKSVMNKLKKSSGNSVSCNQVLDNVTTYECNIEGCRMNFRTRAQLSSHKNNKCHHKDCGKRFQSHKYVVLHQRVHEDERPLKCTWKGCTMSFKWAWARTEHMRLHTGERPYKCKIKGCGLTFRFVSDFSRHRRKTGHHANPTPK